MQVSLNFLTVDKICIMSRDYPSPTVNDRMYNCK